MSPANSHSIRPRIDLQVVDKEATAKAQAEADKKAQEEGKEPEKVAPGGCTPRLCRAQPSSAAPSRLLLGIGQGAGRVALMGAVMLRPLQAMHCTSSPAAPPLQLRPPHSRWRNANLPTSASRPRCAERPPAALHVLAVQS